MNIGEFEILAAALEIILGGVRIGVVRNVVLRTDNQNVLRWPRKGKEKDGEANRILKSVIGFAVNRNIEDAHRY